MIYVVGIVGFIGGFLAGQMVLYFLLRHKTNRELLTDHSLKVKYGLLCWAFAVLGSYSFMEMYKYYFVPS